VRRIVQIDVVLHNTKYHDAWHAVTFCCPGCLVPDVCLHVYGPADVSQPSLHWAAQINFVEILAKLPNVYLRENLCKTNFSHFTLLNQYDNFNKRNISFQTRSARAGVHRHAARLCAAGRPGAGGAGGRPPAGPDRGAKVRMATSCDTALLQLCRDAAQMHGGLHLLDLRLGWCVRARQLGLGLGRWHRVLLRCDQT
jgi:hypothetical protein